MAFKYKEDYPATDEVLDPADWMDSMDTFAGEFNGKLDRDNLPESAVDGDHIPDDTIAAVSSSGRSSGITLDGASVGWVSAVSGTDLLSHDFTTSVDTVVDITCSFRWAWAYAWNSIAASTVDEYLVGWRLVVDGVEIARSQDHSALRRHDSLLLMGTYVAPPGEHTAQLEAWVRHEDGGPSGQDLDLELGQIIIEQIRR